MPNVFGIKLLPLILATAAFYFVGFLWYGVLFMDMWMSTAGYTEADFDGSSPAWMVLGVLISLLTVIGIGKVLQWTNAQSIGDAVQKILIIWVAFGLTMALYGLAYTPAHSLNLFLIDASHLLIGWLLAAVILAAMK